MKFLLLLPLLALLSGCSSTSTILSPSVIQSSVAAGTALGLARYPEAKPAVTIATDVICAAASGTNLSPVSVTAAIENSQYSSLKTPEAVFIVQAGVTAYTIAYNGLLANSVSNAPQFRIYLEAVCSGLSQGLHTSPDKFRAPNDLFYPYLSFP